MKIIHRGRARTALRALFVAAVLWALVPGAASAAPLTCMPPTGSDYEFSPGGDLSAFACQTVARTYSPTATSNLFEFDFYPAGFAFSNRLSFDSVLREFTLNLSAFFITPGDAAFLSRIPAGYAPETYATTFGPAWIYFYVEDLQDSGEEPQQGIDFAGNWIQDILWFGDGAYVDPQVLRDPRGGNNVFTDVITVPGSFDPLPTPVCHPIFGCGPLPPPPCDDEVCSASDPRILGTANDFSGTTVVSRVPEPSTILMLGLGVAGALTHVRRQGRRRHDPR